MKMKLRTKILSGFGLILVLMAVVALMGNRGMTDQGDSYNYVLEKRIPITTAIMNLDAHIKEEVIQVRGFMLYKNEDSVDKLKNIKDDIKELQQSMEDLFTTPKGKELFGKIKEAENEYYTNAEKIIEFYRVGNEAAAQTYINQAVEALDRFGEASDQLIQLNDSLIVENVKAAQDASKQAKGIAMVVALGAAVIGISIGAYFGRLISNPVVALTDVAKRVADGDLTTEVVVSKTGDEIEVLSNSFKVMVNNLKNILTHINEVSHQVTATSEQMASNANQASSATTQVAVATEGVAKGNNEQTMSIAQSVEATRQLVTAIEQIARGAQEQSQNVIVTAEVVGQMAKAVEEVANSAQSMSATASLTTDKAQRGSEAVNKTVEGMEQIKTSVFEAAQKISELGEHSNQIGEIIEVIDDIAAQTNLLALNAAIEAARAGEHGKGFAVVADEVRKLAERSSTATKEIAELVRNIQQGTAKAVEAMNVGTEEVTKGATLAIGAGAALKDILVMVDQSVQQIQGISAASEQMAASSTEATRAIDSVAAITEENAAATEQMNANSDNVMNILMGISAISQENASAAEEVSASTEELNASVEEIAASAKHLEDMAIGLQAVIKKFKI